MAETMLSILSGLLGILEKHGRTMLSLKSGPVGIPGKHG